MADPEEAGLSEVDVALVRTALERAIEVARQGAGSDPVVDPPRELVPYLSFRQLSGPAAATVARLIDDDEGFRARVVALTHPEEVDAAGWLFLTRPAGWAAVLTAVGSARAESAGSEQAERRLRDLARRLDVADQKLEAALAELARHQDEAEAAGEELAALRRERRRVEEDLAAAEHRVEELDAKVTERDARVAEAQGAREAREHELAETRQRLAEVEADLARRPPAPVPGEARIDVDALREALSRLERSSATLGRAVDAVASQVPPAPVVLDDRDPPPAGRRATRLPGGLVDDSVEGAWSLLGQPGVTVLVDGYNVAKAAWPGEDLGAQRRRLVRALDELATRSGAAVDVVFDGPADAEPTARQGTPSVAVRYSGGALADDVVLDRIAAVPADRPVVVVSNDREVRDGARRRGANVVGSDTLIALFR